ncbi:hypothetical protein GCM10012320_04880 [Sinomonas cellulolyticus]|uniref:DUF2795 domain-containing protein n=1 Tax=Sinomonas cellulolyticus TaxID=2801916 RepID=A0ABS1K2P8_9MICC|nr:MULTISPECIES: DUF2795 domain-containing protein [Sinomonas]MBL0705819.1 DUF2795 domain-containing protein [Sinomonas cellulolyticus]GHG42181.1 hypothetical protein GCM10012320_04880 [Sinomonas sp. KCTC 49339]
MTNSENPIQIQKFLAGVDYPAEKSQLLEAAKSHGADSNVTRALNSIPDRSYAKPTEVSQAISDAGNHPERGNDGDAGVEADDDERGDDRFDAG